MAAQNPSAPAVDAAAVVRRAVANRFAAEKAHRPQRFFFHKHDEKRDFVQEIVETSQGDVAMLVAVNGQPLTPAARAAERNRLNTLDVHPEMQEHRRRREQDDADRANALLRLLPDAFLYQYESTVPCNDTTLPAVTVPGMSFPEPLTTAPAVCYRMKFEPNTDWDPPNLPARVLRGMTGEIWIETTQERLVRLDAHLISDVDFGWGIVGRLYKGGSIQLRQSVVGEDNWELTGMKMDFSGRAFLIKPVSFRITEEMAHFEPIAPGTDYHQAIRMLVTSQPPAR